LDNLTHSMVGALLGQTGLKRLTGRAMATLIIAANIPDIDALASVFGTESLAMRRGITHGPIALLVLPLLLTGLVLLYNRWRPANQPVRAAPLLLLAYIGTLSHPALDWLNSYGIRLLEPFSSRWFAGDTLFIIDVWIWLALFASFFWSRRLEKRGGNWARPAWAGVAAICAYILANGLITTRAEALAHRELQSLHFQPELVVANPQPFSFWSRRMLWRNDSVHGGGSYALGQGLSLDGPIAETGLNNPALAASRERPDVRAFLFWSRMPIVVERGGQAYLTDQRFAGRSLAISGRDGTSFGYDPFTVPLDRPR
jgi:inner membrane protein